MPRIKFLDIKYLLKSIGINPQKPFDDKMLDEVFSELFKRSSLTERRKLLPHNRFTKEWIHSENLFVAHMMTRVSENPEVELISVECTYRVKKG